MSIQDAMKVLILFGRVMNVDVHGNATIAQDHAPPPPGNLYNVERVQNESLQSLDFQSWRTLMGDYILYHPTTKFDPFVPFRP